MTSSPASDSDNDEEGFGRMLVNSLLAYSAHGMLKAVHGSVKFSRGTTSEHHRRVVMAWFRDRHAVEAWYYGMHHRGLLGGGAPGAAVLGSPMRHVDPDYSGPVMVVASITGRAEMDIAIELFQPMHAGLGNTRARLSPHEFTIPHFNDAMPLGWNAWVRNVGVFARLLTIRGAWKVPSPHHTCTLELLDDRSDADTLRARVVVHAHPGPLPPGNLWVPVEPDSMIYDKSRAQKTLEIFAPGDDAKPFATVPIQYAE